MPIKSASGIKPPIGTIIESFSFSHSYHEGEEVHLQDRNGNTIGRLRCLGAHEEVVVPLVGRPPTDVARGCMRFEVIE